VTGIVLDSSALLAVIWNEAGAARVSPVLREAVLSSVNLAEVVQKLVDRPTDDVAIAAVLNAMNFAIEPFERADAIQAGLLRRATKAKGLSIGDRACLALGKRLGLPVYTADRAWAELDLGVEVVLIR
jgi:PIN domain nuclease of toxin-antitoxin system